MDKKNRDDGLILIGMHCQNGTKEEIQKVLDKAKAKFTVVDNGTTPGAGGGIPHGEVYDAAGKMVFDGHPASKEFEKAISKSLKGAKPGAAAPATATTKPATETTPSTSSTAAAGPLVTEREWTDTKGRKMMASVTELIGDKVKFVMGKKSFDFDITLLVEDDQKVIRAASDAKK